MFKKNQDPIIVVVSDGHWNAFGPVTPRALYLQSVLTQMGGVNWSVPNGTYHFNVKRRLFKTEISLLPFEEN